MRIIKFLITLVLVLLVVFVIGGFLIPAKWSVSRSIVIHASPKKIYPLVSHFKNWEKWSPWNSSKDATLKYHYEGPASGKGAKQSWTSEKMGKGSMIFTSASRENGVTYDLFIDMGQSQCTIQGALDFTAKDDDTEVTWTDHGDSGSNLIKRWMSFIFKPMLGKDMETGLQGLKTLAEKNND